MKAAWLAALVMQACASQPPAPAPEVVADEEPDALGFVDEPSPQERSDGGEPSGRIAGIGDIDTGSPPRLPPSPPRPRGDVSHRHELSEQCHAGNIETVVKRRTGAFEACYEQQVNLHPDLAGTVLATWHIGSDGRPAGLRVSDEGLGNKATIDCIERTLKRAAFEYPQPRCQVRWWFTFVMLPP